MTTSAELLAIRRALGLTQSRMARLVGIETGSYALQEQGKRRPRAAQLELMRRILADHAARGWCPTCGDRLAVEAHGGYCSSPCRAAALAYAEDRRVEADRRLSRRVVPLHSGE